MAVRSDLLLSKSLIMRVCCTLSQAAGRLPEALSQRQGWRRARALDREAGSQATATTVRPAKAVRSDRPPAAIVRAPSSLSVIICVASAESRQAPPGGQLLLVTGSVIA